MKTTVQIRRELKKLILKKKKTCTTEKEINKAVNDARAEINAKYGHSWRNESNTSKQSCSKTSPSFYEGHTHGQHWMD